MSNSSTATSEAAYVTGETTPDSEGSSEEELSDEEVVSKDEWSIGSSGAKTEQPIEDENHLEKPRQRILTANREWLIALVALYIASMYFDALIAGDVMGYGIDEPIWVQTTFPVFYETPEIPEYDNKGEIVSTTPIPELPLWKDLMEGELIAETNVHPDDYKLTLKLIQPAIVPVIAGVVDVQQTGIMQVEIRFFKPYIWGRPSATQTLNVLLEKAANPGSDLFTRIANPRAEERGQPNKFDTFNMNLGSPLKGRINEDSGQQEAWLTQGRNDGRPPSQMYIDIFVGLQLVGMIGMGITSVLLNHFAWGAQCEEHGDVRLSVKQDDPKAHLYRMKWPVWVILMAALFRLEAIPELIECLKSKKEYWTLICILTVGNVLQIIPSLILQLYFAHGSGAGPSFGIMLSVICKMSVFCGTMVLWERSNAFTGTNVAIKLSWDAHYSSQLSFQRVALYRFFGLMSRVLPLAVLMTMYSELAAAYVFGLDAVVLFFMMVHTSLRQRCTLGNEKCSCGNLCYFYTTRLPALLFFYNDSYMGRSYDNSIMHPLLYLCARGISLGAITYYWWYAQQIVWGPLGALPSPTNETVNWTMHEERAWLLASNTTFPDGMITDDPLSGFPTLVAGGFFFVLYIFAFTDTWKRAGKYYDLPPARRRGLCFCWAFIIDNCFRRLCGMCGGKNAIPPPPPKSKFGGQKMDAAAIDASRPKASLMLKRLRANATTRTGETDSYNKYRTRTDEEMRSVGSVYSINEENGEYDEYGENSKSTMDEFEAEEAEKMEQEEV